ncbi:unnamed protein product, partial [Mycena citricolor]
EGSMNTWWASSMDPSREAACSSSGIAGNPPFWTCKIRSISLRHSMSFTRSSPTACATCSDILGSTLQSSASPVGKIFVSLAISSAICPCEFSRADIWPFISACTLSSVMYASRSGTS